MLVTTLPGIGDRSTMLIVDGVAVGITEIAVGGMIAIEVGGPTCVSTGSVVTLTDVGTLLVTCADRVGVEVGTGVS
ncbi:MAG: hypothetical protein DWB44_11735 [Chloroflexi bacterium]|nr:hypothetical protein [Chloroflexota bacterium]